MRSLGFGNIGRLLAIGGLVALPLACIDENPVVEGVRRFTKDAEPEAQPLADPTLEELPNCVSCSAALALETRYQNPACRKDTPASLELFNKVIESCCTEACSTPCGGLCEGGAMSEACSQCTYAKCAVALTACKGKQ
jgi:hypothetical protein